MTLTARPRFLIRFAVLAALALCGVVLALSSTGTPPVGAQDGSAPDKPTGVVFTATHDSVTLAWDDPSDASITHYQIFRRDRDVHDAGEFVTITENTGSAATSYTDDTVEPEKRYVYRVKAVNQHGASTWSNFVRADTPAAPDPADLAPSGLEVSLVENRVTLTWDAPASDAASVTGYEILRRRPNDGEAALTTLVANTGNAETGYTDDTANEPGVRYTYRVKALRDGEQSRVSNYARIDLPDDYAQDTPGSDEPTPTPEALAPSGLTAAVEDGGVALSWTAPAEHAGSVTGYEVLRAQGSAELATLAADTGNTDTTYTDSGVTGDLDGYRYQVKALRGGDASQGSNVAGVLQSAHAGAIVPLDDVTLISNLGQSSQGGGDFSNDQAQAFTTGSNSGGYSLTKVVLHSRLGVAADFTVSVHENDSGAPGTSLGTLTNPTLPATGETANYEFTHSGIDLAASTTYFIVVDVSTSSASYVINNTNSDAEDTGGATGWSIGDSSLYRGFGSTGSWTTWAQSKRISMTGTVTGGTTNNAPVFADATTTRSVPENSAVGTNVGSAVTATDADSDTLEYTLEGTDAASFAIVSTSGQIQTKTGVTYNHEGTSSYSVTVKADDGNGGTDTIGVTITVSDVDEAPSAPGAPDVTAASGTTDSLVVDWKEPANTGPAINDYDVQYRKSSDTAWTAHAHAGTATTTTITGLEASTSYQVHVLAKNAEGTSDWSASGTGSTGTSATGALISNVGQTAATGAAQVSTSQSQAQGFTTGSDSGGYTLGSVELAVSSFSGTASDITVSIYSESSGDPGTVVHTLTTPASISAAVTTFTAPSGATLAAGTTYYVVISTTSSGISLSRTNATAEDTGGVSGWSIADSRRFFGGSGWNTTTNPIRMRINGDAATTSTDATLSSLVLNDGTNDLTLTPTFASGTTSYMASVDNAVSQITVTPTKSDSDASVEYLDGNDAAISDADGAATGHQVALEVGENTIKVKVTAEDDATTETYTVVVTCQAQTAEVTLISNLGKFRNDGGNFTNDQTQAFTTGSNSGGYSLTKVVIASNLSASANFTVSVHENDSGAPGTSLGTLTNPTLLATGEAGNYEFTHSDIDLAASTTFFIVVDVSTSSSDVIHNTDSDAEDTGGATGWSIGDSSLYRGFGSTGSWTTWAQSKKISITGTVTGGTTNNAATGAPVVSGTPAVGELLTADISNIGDSDGIADADFEYQWIAFDGTTDSDISGATGETYRPLLAHLDQTIKVRVSFDDDDDNAESLTSAATAAVTASTYGQVIWSATLTVEEETVAAGTFFGYAVLTRGSLEPISFTHDGLTAFVSILQYLEGAQLRWEFSGGSLGSADFNLYLDGAPFLIESPGTDTFLTFSDHGLTWTDEQEVEVRLTVNRAATGAPAITGTPEVGETLTAGISAIMDEDGVPAAAQFAYQWISDDGTDDSDIDGATDSTYTLVEADAGKTIKVRVSFTDNAKFPESLTSAATTAVTVPVAALVSNVGQTAAGNANVTATQSQGQGFTTGSDSGGYTLGSVELAVSSFSGTASDITVSIYSESSGDPGTLVHTLTTPASIATPVTTFTAPSGTTLAANTTYYVVISTTGSGINLSRTNAAAEDTGGASGWSIADDRRFFGGGNWVNTSSPIRMRVNGDAASTDIWSATLTVAIGGSFYGYSSISGDGDLEPAEFTYNGNPAEVQILAYSGNVFYFRTSPALDSGDYFLFLDDTPIQLGAASGSPPQHQVSDHGLTWTADQQVEVRLALNNAPTGQPVITGTPVVSQTLTADISGIMDTDGRPADDQFSYRWIRSDGATDSDISGATNATYKLGSADLDKTIKVRVTFTDGGGFPERLTSDATGPVTPLTVSSDWSLVPSGLGPGDRFRLMFISSGGRNARPTSIDTYNTWIQNLAAAGHTDIQSYSSAFNVVGSTVAVDARDNTGTTYTSSDKGVPIYWLNGNKVADQYQDFYDGGWDEEASMRNQSGSSVSAPIPATGVWTGSDHDGTEALDALGDSNGFTTIGKPNSGGSGDGPLRSNTSQNSGQTKKLYGLSDVFEVEAIEVPADWSLVPSGLNPGDRFRLMFLTTSRNATPTDIDVYNEWVQDRAAGGHDSIREYAGAFYLLGCTEDDAARDNTRTTYTDDDKGVPIYWLNGPKVVDEYEDLYDGDWDQEAKMRTRSGTEMDNPQHVWTGCGHNGAVSSGAWLGHDMPTIGLPDGPEATGGPLSSSLITAKAGSLAVYALSEVFEVAVVAGSNTPATGKPTISGTPQVDQTLTADISSIMDADGLPAAAQFSYQWISDDSDIDGATDSTYTLVEADAGKTITVRVSFTDNANNPESLTSDATVTVLEMVVPEVPFNWSLKPSGLVVGDQFRLLFVSSTGRDASSESIDAYNTWIQSLAAAGHTDIQRYSSTFTVVGSTAADDARDNTGTTYTSSDKGVPIYWLNGNKVADQYEDFYDGDWDDEANRKTEAGTASSDTTIRTGSDPDGTEKGFGAFSLALGKSLATVGIPDSSATGSGPLSSDTNAADSSTLPLYGLSGVFTVVAPPPTEVPSTWSLIPSGLGEGDEFRLLFVSSTTRNAASASISTYNTWIQNQAAAGHTDIQDYSDTFRVVGSTAAVDARDNTYSTYTSSDKGVPIYWLNGNKVVDQYEDFYDGGWDDEANPTTEAGASTSATGIWTGSDDDGTESFTSSGTSFALGKEFVAIGSLNHATLGPVGDSAFNGGKSGSRPFYGLSAVFRVGQGPPTVVPADWSLKPSGVVAGQEFRLLFLSSTKRSIRSTNISDYNTFVQNRAAAGHTDIQDYSDTFRVLGSTGAVDARDNTRTTYTSSDKGVRIYWLNGDKAADEYQDFYDGSWDQQADAWNESGVEYDLSARRFVATGSSRDGTAEQSNSLGASSGEVQLGCLYQTSSVNGPVFCRFTTENISADDNQQLYGLSGVFQVTSNNPASGAPTISGTLEVRQTLTADISGIMDEDGLPFLVQFSYQWIRSDGTTDSDISGATDSTYTLEDADQGKTIKVRVTFTDEGGTEETLTSDATTAVAADTTGPVVEEVTCFDSLCNLVFDELLDENLNNVPLTIAFAITADGAAITVGIAFPLIDGRFQVSSLAPQIRQGQTVKVVYTDPTSGDDTKAIQDAAGNDAADFTTGEDGVPAVTNDSTLARVAPGAPTGLTATPNGATQIDLAWTAPADNGGEAITGYQIEYSDDGGTSWSVLDPDTQSTDTLYSDITLTGGETRHYRVSAINSIGTGAASNSPPTGKPVITGTPEVKQTLTADISGIVDADGLPADDQFSYQWIRNDGTDDSDISGATDSTYS